MYDGPNPNRLFSLLIVVSSLSMSCGSKAEGGSASASPHASANGANATNPANAGSNPSPSKPTGEKKTCADYGGKGEGTFEKPCDIPASPFEAKWTGKTDKTPFDKEVSLIEITSKADRAVDWGMVSVWCYDASGTQVPFSYPNGSQPKRWYSTGSGNLRALKNGKDSLAPGQTILMAGPEKSALPPSLDSCVVEVTEWGWEKGDKLYLSVDHSKVPNMDIRPKDGFQ